MKKNLVSLLLLSLLVSSGPLFAREESPSPALTVGSLPGESAVSEFPLRFAVSPGKWSQARAGEIFTSGVPAADFILPALKEAPTPIRYPRWAVREGWEGSFVIAVEVLKNGEVGRWKVIESTGYSLLDQAATEAIRRWKFHPAQEKGRPVVSCIQIPVHFEILFDRQP